MSRKKRFKNMNNMKKRLIYIIFSMIYCGNVLGLDLNSDNIPDSYPNNDAVPGTTVFEKCFGDNSGRQSVFRIQKR